MKVPAFFSARGRQRVDPRAWLPKEFARVEIGCAFAQKGAGPLPGGHACYLPASSYPMAHFTGSNGRPFILGPMSFHAADRIGVVGRESSRRPGCHLTALHRGRAFARNSLNRLSGTLGNKPHGTEVKVEFFVIAERSGALLSLHQHDRDALRDQLGREAGAFGFGLGVLDVGGERTALLLKTHDTLGVLTDLIFSGHGSVLSDVPERAEQEGRDATGTNVIKIRSEHALPADVSVLGVDMLASLVEHRPDISSFEIKHFTKLALQFFDAASRRSREPDLDYVRIADEPRCIDKPDLAHRRAGSLKFNRRPKILVEGERAIDALAVDQLDHRASAVAIAADEHASTKKQRRIPCGLGTDAVARALMDVSEATTKTGQFREEPILLLQEARRGKAGELLVGARTVDAAHSITRTAPHRIRIAAPGMATPHVSAARQKHQTSTTAAVASQSFRMIRKSAVMRRPLHARSERRPGCARPYRRSRSGLAPAAGRAGRSSPPSDKASSATA